MVSSALSEIRAYTEPEQSPKILFNQSQHRVPVCGGAWSIMAVTCGRRDFPGGGHSGASMGTNGGGGRFGPASLGGFPGMNFGSVIRMKVIGFLATN